MKIGVPKERLPGEARVGLTPALVRTLTKNGHTCLIETGAGAGAGFDDYDYERQGAHIVPDMREIYTQSDLILKVMRPLSEEIALMREGQVLMGLLGLLGAPKEDVRALVARKVTAIAYEHISCEGHIYPVLKAMSEVTGRMAPYIAGMALMRHGDVGRGVLLGGVPGVSAAEVVILGGGVLGFNAARAFVGLGAKVFVLSRNLDRLRALDDYFRGAITTMVSHDYTIANTVRFADVVIGAARTPGQRPPLLITRAMLRTMRVNAVLIDFTIDHGGCAETSCPTTLENPTYVEEDIIHYCVPNVPGSVPRTSTAAFLNAAIPYFTAVANLGPATACAQRPELQRAVILRSGEILDQTLARDLD